MVTSRWIAKPDAETCLVYLLSSPIQSILFLARLWAVDEEKRHQKVYFWHQVRVVVLGVTRSDRCEFSNAGNKVDSAGRNRRNPNMYTKDDEFHEEVNAFELRSIESQVPSGFLAFARGRD